MIKGRQHWFWVALALVILFVVVVRVRLLNVPLERDEGEFAYVGQLMLDGIAPYKLAYVMKLPGTAAVYALSMALFGQTAAGIHLGLLLANVAAIVLVFLLAKKWFGADVGLIAGVTYALMSLSRATLGSAAHATQFVVPAALGGILLLLRSLESGRRATLFWSGILFGLTFLLKQPGIFFGAFGGLLLLAKELKAHPVHWMPCLKKAGIYCLGIILPFAVLCLILWRAGVFERFWYWTVTVAGGNWASWGDALHDLKNDVARLQSSHQWPFWILTGLALPFVFWMRRVRPLRLPFLAFCAVSIFAVCLGGRFHPHYFVLLLPAIGMVIGLGVVEARQFFKNSKSLAFASFLPIAVFCVVYGYAILGDKFYFFRAAPDEIVPLLYGYNPFREAVQVADYIKKNSAPDSRIAVLGSEPEIYFLAHRHSATGHVATYVLMEGRPYSQDLQEEMSREIKVASPEYIVYVDNAASWIPNPKYEKSTLVETMVASMSEHDRYKLVGVAANRPFIDQPVYYWDAVAQNLPEDVKAHGVFIFVFKLQNQNQ